MAINKIAIVGDFFAIHCLTACTEIQHGLAMLMNIKGIFMFHFNVCRKFIESNAKILKRKAPSIAQDVFLN
jgi:hypothetical protein